MNFLQISKDIPLFSFTNYIFSIGVYNSSDRELERQLFFPIPIKKLQNTIVFGIDAEFVGLTERQAFYVSDIKLDKVGKSNIYVNKKKNITLVIISQNLVSDYPPLETQDDFEESLKYPPLGQNWFHFYYFISALIQLGKSVYINNWAYFNTNSWRLVNGRAIIDRRNSGNYFELFPEMGFIFNIINLHFTDPPVFLTVEGIIYKLSSIDTFRHKNPLLDKWVSMDKTNPFLPKKQQKQSLVEKSSTRQQRFPNYQIIQTTQKLPLKKFSSEEAIRDYIHSSHIYRIPIARDGSCLFGSFSRYLQNSSYESEPLYIRRKIVSWEKLQMQRQITNVLAQQQIPSFQAYLQRMSLPTTYGGEPEIIAFTQQFKFNVAIIDVERNTVTIYMTTTTPQPAETLFLLYYSTIKHYDVALLAETGYI
jgi:hypothetical protein